MRYQVEYDNESDGDTVELQAADLPILGQLPETVEGGRVAIYDFVDSVPEEDILEDLDNASWCFTSAGRIEDTPEP
jgi:hypothetical protein